MVGNESQSWEPSRSRRAPPPPSSTTARSIAPSTSTSTVPPTAATPSLSPSATTATTHPPPGPPRARPSSTPRRPHGRQELASELPRRHNLTDKWGHLVGSELAVNAKRTGKFMLARCVSLGVGHHSVVDQLRECSSAGRWASRRTRGCPMCAGITEAPARRSLGALALRGRPA